MFKRIVLFFIFLIILACSAQDSVKNQTAEGRFYHEGRRGGWPPYPTLEDKNICTLNAQVLLVLGGGMYPFGTGGIGVSHVVGAAYPDPARDKRQIGPGFRNPGNVVLAHCSEIATVSELSCTTCCRVSGRFLGVEQMDVIGLLVDQFGFDFRNRRPGCSPLPPFRQKRSISGFNPLTGKDWPCPPDQPGGTAAKLPPASTKCMCCSPRRAHYEPRQSGFYNGIPPPPPYYWGGAGPRPQA